MRRRLASFCRHASATLSLFICACGGVAGSGAPSAATSGPTAVGLIVPYTPPSAAATVAARVTPAPPTTPTTLPTVVPTLIPGAAVTFAQVQQLFTSYCTGCHPNQQGMDLSQSRSYAMLVDVPSREVSTLMRVKPGDPDKSYLYDKISRAKPQEGAQMPLNGDPLSAAEQSVIREWIAQGAKP